MRDFVRTALNVGIRHTNAAVASDEGVLEDHANVFHAIQRGNAERPETPWFR